MVGSGTARSVISPLQQFNPFINLCYYPNSFRSVRFLECYIRPHPTQTSNSFLKRLISEALPTFLSFNSQKLRPPKPDKNSKPKSPQGVPKAKDYPSLSQFPLLSSPCFYTFKLLLFFSLLFMAKSLQSAPRLHELSRFVSSAKSLGHRPNQTHSILPNRVAIRRTAISGAIKVESQPAQLKMKNFEGKQCRIPLALVVADCAKRWFQDTLKEAKAGDSAMQVLVGQMYYSGYGVPRDPQKGHAWISKASRTRNSAWKVSDKHPGYRESDSNSDEAENKAKRS